MEKFTNLSATEDPFEIDERDRRILQMMIDQPDISINAIAKLLAISPSAVSLRKKKPAFKKAYADLMATTDELMMRAQKIAARRLLSMIKDPDKKIALEAMKMALSPLLNKHSVDIKEEIVFQTRIGTQGQLMQEVIEVGNNRKLSISAKPEAQDDSEDTPNDTLDNP